MKAINTSKFALSALAAALLACSGASAKVMEDTVATVNGEPVLRSEYTRFVGELTERYRATMPKFFEQKDADRQLSKQVLDEMISTLLVEQAAKSAKVIVRDREVQDRLEKVRKTFAADENGRPLAEAQANANFEKELKKEALTLDEFRARLTRQMTAEKYVQQTLQPKLVQPADSEIKKFYDKLMFVVKGATAPLAGMSEADAQEVQLMARQVRDMSAERVRVRHIFIKADEKAPLVEKNKALETAKDIKKQLDNGADFAELAKKHSQEAESAARGGDIGPMIKGMGLPAEFEKQAFALPVGQVGEPFATPLGYHILRVDEHRVAQSPQFDELREQLGQYLMNRQFKAELKKLVESLRAKASVVINEDKSKN